MGLIQNRPIETQKLGLGFLVGFFLFSAAYFSMYNPYNIPFATESSLLFSIPGVPTSPVEERMNSQQLGSEIATLESKFGCNNCGVDATRVHGGSLSATSDVKQLESRSEMKASSSNCDDKISDQCRLGSDGGIKESSSNINSSTQKEEVNSTQLEYGSRDGGKPERKPMCDVSDPRFDFCEMDGNIRIYGNSTVVLLNDSSRRNESWRIKPYPRKLDSVAMANVREMTLKTLNGYKEPPLCTLNHSVPAIVFSIAGYTGNYFHDFSDVLIPLFITSYQFAGEVQFLISGIRSWWIQKYLPIFSKLSRYEIIDFDTNDQVHCFSHAIVGLRSHKELSIDPSRSPNEYSMVDFAKVLKTAYALPKQSLIPFGEHSSMKPRLLLIARSQTRKFTNIRKIVRMAKKLGYDVVVAEANSGSDINQFAQIVNSCDVMMGVHGAGLTNLVFLPTNAVVIQIVPLGMLESIANTDFGVPATDMKLRYSKYNINEEESTLLDLYPRDHPVFRDPLSIHKLGWNAMSEIYLVKQNVRLNVKRFRPVLLKALKLLR